MADEQLEREHAGLLGEAEIIVRELRGFASRVTGGSVLYWQHTEFCDRAAELADHLDAVTLLARRAMYASSFALLRTALEHHVIDYLLLLGRRHVQIYKDVGDYEFDRLHAAWKAGEKWSTSIESLERRKNDVRVVRRGVPVRPEGSDGPGYEISVYYAVLDEHSPFVGPPHQQEYLDDGLTPLESRTDYARRNQRLHSQFLRWESLKEGLALNDFASMDELRQLDVHYRFLSAFTHASKAGYERTGDRSASGFDHYCSELALLYVIELGCREVRILMEMAAAPPTIEVAHADELESVLCSAESAASHLWFPGGSPSRYDVVQEANRRAFRRVQTGDPTRPFETPEEVRPAEVGYYSDPLGRLAGLHGSFQEMLTGFLYESPWPRDDAMSRRR